ncbi:MAG: hypothetical protein OHK0021_15710 [Bryobacter sp.]
MAGEASPQDNSQQDNSRSLEALAAAFRAKPGPATRAKVESFLLRHPKDADGALARLVLFNGDTTAQGRAALGQAKSYLPALVDYVDYAQAATALAAKDYAAAAAFTEAVVASPLAQRSPTLGKALLTGLEAYRELGDGEKMLRLLNRHGKALTEAQRLYYAGWAAELSGKASEARKNFARLQVDWPRTTQAQDAAQRLPVAHLTLEEQTRRAFRLLDTGDPRGARTALLALVPKLSGKEQDLARVRAGVAEYRLRLSTAKATLGALQVNDPAADAERLFFLLLAARRANDNATVGDAIAALNERHPNSPWRMEGLANAASQFWTAGEAAKSLPLYQACAEEFQAKPESRPCAWRYALASHLTRQAEAEDRLLAYLASDPAGGQASAALYFLGRNAEQRQDRGAAKTYYTRAIALFPNHFYAELSRERLEEAKLSAVAERAEVAQKLDRIEWGEGPVVPSFNPSPATAQRMKRAELLARGALYDWAEGELRHEGRGSPESAVLALAAAQMAERRGAPDVAVRYIKSLYPSYVNLPMSAVTAPLLRLAYPLPYKDDLLTQAFKNELDPYVVAGLIRQESEFSPQALSRSRAHGLMQIMPATGQELARRMKLGRFSRSMLFDPRTNLAMGTYYFKRLADSWGGNLAQALASYNAGRGRVTQWMKRFGGEAPDDMAEFVETIPFEETRNYVQQVLRNAAMYKRIYGPRPLVVVPPAEPVVSAPKKAAPVKKSAPVKKAAPKKKTPASKQPIKG